jgi:hypothetical protein
LLKHGHHNWQILDKFSSNGESNVSKERENVGFHSFRKRSALLGEERLPYRRPKGVQRKGERRRVT